MLLWDVFCEFGVDVVFEVIFDEFLVFLVVKLVQGGLVQGVMIVEDCVNFLCVMVDVYIYGDVVFVE